MQLAPHALAAHLMGRITLLRAIRSASWIGEDGRLAAVAFMRDSRRDPDGLSVGIQELVRSPEQLHDWLTRILSKSYGADAVQTSKVRELGLEIGQTRQDLDEDPTHALIVGVPTQDEDPKTAEDLAGKLASLTSEYDRTKRQRR